MTEQHEIDTIELTGELLALSEQLDDPSLDKAIKYAVKLIERPDIPVPVARKAIVELEAIAAKFGFVQVYYKTFGRDGQDERFKKDIYYTARDAVRHLVDALKYVVRAQEVR